MGDEEEEEISNDDEKTGCCSFFVKMFGRLLFRQGYIDLAVMKLEPGDRRDRLVGEWSAYGVIMSLLAGFAVTIYMAPPQTPDGSIPDNGELTAFGILIIIAAAANFFGVLLTVAYYSSFNIVPIKFTKKWIKWHSWILGLPNLFLIAGLLSFVGAMIIAARIIYSEGVFIFICALIGCLVILFLCLYMFSPIAMTKIRKGV